MAWTEGVVTFWRDRLRNNPRLRICVPSGHTPNRIFEGISRSVAAGQASFRDSEIFALDEFGGLSPQDEGRCENMLRRYLINQIDLPRERFYILDTEAEDVAQVCRQYDKAIGDRLDLTLLGIGLNGHLGMNEPGSAADSTTRRVDLHPTTIQSSAKYLHHSNLPRWGITVGMKQLLASKEVWLLANGKAKAEIIHKIVKGEITPEVPGSLMRKHPNCFLMLDAQAAALL
jgi:glucosamine-6-phosphate isomerase